MKNSDYMAREDRALFYAKHAHGEQKRRHTEEPYWHHPLRVANMVKATPRSTIEMVEAAYLHDVLEDTDVTEAELRLLFSPVTVDYVVWLTDPPKEAGNRAKRKAMTIERLARAPNPVKTIKLADILDNAPSLKAHDPKFFPVWAAEKRESLPSLIGGNSALFTKVVTLIS